MRILLLSFTLSFFAFVDAQEKSPQYKKLEHSLNYTKGYILGLNGKKIEGLVKVKMSEISQFQNVKFVHFSGQKRKYFPNDIKGFGYYSMNFESIEGSFYEVLLKGERVDLLRNVSVSYGPGVMVGMSGGMSPTMSSSKNDTRHLRNNETGELSRVRRFDFKSSTTEYFSDCDQIVQKIENKELRFRDLKKIVDLYNRCEN